MEKRKNPEKDLRNKSGLFFQIGLLLSMMLVVSAFEYRSKDNNVMIPELDANIVEEILIPLTKQDPPPPPPPKPILANPIEAEPDDIEIEMPDIIIDVEEFPDVIPEPEPSLEPEEKAPEFVDYAEVMPAFEGFYKYLSKNMKYPSAPRRMGLDGKVFIQFVVDEDGKVTNAKVFKGIHKDLDAEALRVVSQSPNWSPGRQAGRRIKVRMIVPIVFRLN